MIVVVALMWDNASGFRSKVDWDRSVARMSLWMKTIWRGGCRGLFLLDCCGG
jgi:hypothetical protein